MDKKKIKTIQMQYPAPYSQSWPSPPVKKPKKVASVALASKRMQYPAPYFQSWPNSLVKKPKKVASAALAKNQKVQKHTSKAPNDWSKRQAVCRGSDPTAPHLKYGVFNNRRPVIRIQPRLNTNIRPLKYELDLTSEHSINMKKIKKTVRKAQPADETLEFCTVDKHNSKHLTKTEVKHMDIRPRQPPLSPVVRTSYNIRRSPPLSPVSRFIKRGD